MKRYILSQDIGLLIKKWARERKFRTPNSNYFYALTKEIASDLQLLFDKNKKNIKVELISAVNILKKTGRIKAKEDDFVVSLDKVFFTCCDYQFEINRIVQFDGVKWKNLGEGPRPNSKPLNEQLDEIVGFVKDTRKIILIDDGCWTAGSMKKIIKGLLDRDRGVKVKKIISGIFIDQGNWDLDIPIQFSYSFNKEDVLDWVCERDFIPGIPLGGKTVIEKLDKAQNIGAYYLFNMGDYKAWASLDFKDEEIKWFSRRRLHQAIELFTQISLLSNKSVLVKDIERIPYGLSIKAKTPFTILLKELVEKLQ